MLDYAKTTGHIKAVNEKKNIRRTIGSWKNRLLLWAIRGRNYTLYWMSSRAKYIYNSK